MTKEQLAAAERIAEALRAEHRRVGDLAWALDSAISLYRKAQPGTGYRSTAKLGDAAWDASEYEARVIAAALNGMTYLIAGA